MAYTRLGLKDGDKVNASHVDHIEDELVSLDDNKADQTAVDQNAKDIATNADAISEINQSLTDKAECVLLNAQSDLYSVLSAYSLYTCATLCTRNNASSTLTNGATSNVTRGIFCPVSASYVDYVLFIGGTIYFGRIGSSGVTQLYTVDGNRIVYNSLTAENSPE